jgi:outer membrane protein OmpA-like peptidoglycan-associated protein
MQIRLTVTFAISLLILGASYAFADGILNDAATTRARGGVGNYLFYPDRSSKTENKNELVNAQGETLFEDEPNSYGDELTIRESSAIVPAQIFNFGPNSSRLPAADRARLDEIAATLKADAGLKVQITGFTDDEGAAYKNQALGEARAQAVAHGLRERGVPSGRISWNGKGERDPISENGSQEGRALNRRAELRFQ